MSQLKINEFENLINNHLQNFDFNLKQLKYDGIFNDYNNELGYKAFLYKYKKINNHIAELKNIYPHFTNILRINDDNNDINNDIYMLTLLNDPKKYLDKFKSTTNDNKIVSYKFNELGDLVVEGEGKIYVNKCGSNNNCKNLYNIVQLKDDNIDFNKDNTLEIKYKDLMLTYLTNGNNTLDNDLYFGYKLLTFLNYPLKINKGIREFDISQVDNYLFLDNPLEKNFLNNIITLVNKKLKEQFLSNNKKAVLSDNKPLTSKSNSFFNSLFGLIGGTKDYSNHETFVAEIEEKLNKKGKKLSESSKNKLYNLCLEIDDCNEKAYNEILYYTLLAFSYVPKEDLSVSGSFVETIKNHLKNLESEKLKKLEELAKVQNKVLLIVQQPY
jgi:hypothetical protein